MQEGGGGSGGGVVGYMEGLGIDYLLAIMQSCVPDLVKYAMHMDTQVLILCSQRPSCMRLINT